MPNPLPQDVEFGRRLLDHFREMLQGADLPTPDPHQIIPQTPQTMERDPYHLADHPIINALLPHLQSLFSAPGNVLGVAGMAQIPEDDLLNTLMHTMSDEGLPKSLPKAVPSIPARDIDWQLRYGSEETPEVAKYLRHTLEDRITDAYNKLDETGRGNSVTFYRLRKELPDVSKQDFDKAVLGMTSGQNSPFLGMLHDSAHRMAAMGQDVSDFVHDSDFDPAKSVGGNYLNRETAPKGRYYVSMYKRPQTREQIFVHH